MINVMLRNCTFLIGLLLFFPVLVTGQTSVPGGIISGETWTHANSPYCIEGDLLINNLIIEPGVIVQFQGNYVFEVQGVVTAIGTNVNEIVFTGGEAHVVDWQGIYFNNSLPGSQLAHCTIEDSVNSGIRIDNSVPTIRYSKIQNNQGIRGGGIDVINVDNFTLDSCEVTGNSVPSGNKGYGGGIFVDSGETILKSCIIDSNSVSVQNHNSVARGGGIYVGGNLTMIDSTVSNNVAYGYANHNYWTVLQYAYGGGIYATSTTSLMHCYILNNSTNSNSYAPGPGGGFAYSFGAGIFFDGMLLDIINCVIGDNTNPAASDGATHREGGGICVYSGTTNLTNSTIAKNLIEGIRNRDGIVTAVNSIFWENSSSQILGDATVTYSDIQGGYAGEGNISLNPVFMGTDDYHIDCTISPVRGMGTNNDSNLPSTDIDGEPRICNDVVDMGADECCPDLIELSANAGPDKIICNQICDEAVLDGRKSQGLIVFYEWELDHEEDLCDKSASGETPTVIDLCSGIYNATLTVTNSNGLTDTNEMVLTVLETCDPCSILQGDFDSDGDVDGDDLRIFSGHFGTFPLTP